MKKVSVFILILFYSTLCVVQCPLCVNASEVSVSAKSAILMSVDNKNVIFAKNENEKLPMASTTKIMTSLIALEQAEHDNKLVTITKEMIMVEGSSMGLREGDKLTLEDLAKGMLMASGNDAANAVAITIGGNAENFAKLMNEKATEIGLCDTHFVTPSGLDNEEHFSTAYDMALLGAYAMQNQSFYQIASQKKATVNFVYPKQQRTYSNHNRLLSLYKYCIGIKTGFTKKSGRCLVSCAKKDDKMLVAVTLNAPSDWNDHIAMFNYGFDTLTDVIFDEASTDILQPVVGSKVDNVTLRAESSVRVLVEKEDINRIKRTVKVPRFSYAPIHKGDVLGTVEYTLDDSVLATLQLKAQADVLFYEDNNIWVKLLKFLNLS